MTSSIPTTTISGKRYAIFGLVILATLIAWLFTHLATLVQGDSASPVFLFMAGGLVFFLGLAWLERPYKGDPGDLTVTVNVPLYQEDPAIVRQVLQSFLDQTRRPDRVDVVDDGSSTDYSELAYWWPKAAEAAGIDGRWVRVPNGGKRHAQLQTFRHAEGDIFCTVDSDSVLTPNAIEEGLKPFADPRVTSVAALVLAANAKSNLLVRLTDLMFTNFQMVNRAGLSVLNSVLVNSGACAFYRASVVRDAIPTYEAESFMGRGVSFSDDSFLTLAAHLQGKTVSQPTCVAYTFLPERVSHHLRQQLRWSRGSTLRSIWRARYLPMTGAAYWVHFVNWLNFALVATVFGYLLAVRPVIHGEFTPIVLAISAAVSYATSLKYLTIRRSDVPFAWQLGTWLMAPLLVVWSALVLRPLRLYGMATCYRTGSWGTRQAGVEVDAGPVVKELAA